MYKNPSKYYDTMNIRMDEDAFARNPQGFIKIYHEVLLLLRKFLQTKPGVKSMSIKFLIFITLLLKIEMKKKLWMIIRKTF